MERCWTLGPLNKADIKLSKQYKHFIEVKKE